MTHFAINNPQQRMQPIVPPTYKTADNLICVLLFTECVQLVYKSEGHLLLRGTFTNVQTA